MNTPVAVRQFSSGDGVRQGSWSDRAHADLPLLSGLTLLAGVGLLVLYSSGGQDWSLLLRQGIRLLLAFTVMGLLAQIPPRHYFRWAPWLYVVSLGLLILVLLIGEIGKGAQRWLDLGLFRFQPSELMKLALPLMLARVVGQHPLPPDRLSLLYSGVLLVVPVLLIAKQPDLGTALLVASAGAFVVLLGGISWRWVGAAVLLAVPAVLGLWTWGMHDYQRQRVLTFLDPQRDPLGTGYHIIQSQIALGSGGIYGKGWLNGTQSHLDFLPERSTDFIFAVFGEEFGLLGIVLLLLLYLAVVVRGLYIGTQAQDSFSRLLVGSITLTFFVYVFVNTGMVIGLLPVVGLPLPLISYGGTSLVTVMAAFGILMSIHTHRKLLSS